MGQDPKLAAYDFKGLGYSKIGHFKEVRAKIKELEGLNLELARRHHKLATIIDSMSDGLTILNRDLDIILANKVQKAMFPDISLEGKKCYRTFFRKDHACRNCPALKTMERQEVLSGEFLIKEGEFAGRFCEWTTSPLRGASGQVEQVLLLMRDVTERKEYEFKLMQTDRMAAIGLLADGIAHEINNPLTSIAGFSEALLKRLGNNSLPGEKKPKLLLEYLDIINKEAHRCKEIVRQLHDFNRKPTHGREVLDVGQIINATVSLIRTHAKHNNTKIKVKNSLATGFDRVEGNEAQMKHAFLNLIHFLLGVMPDGGELTITARNSGNLIEVILSASGGRLPAHWHENAMHSPYSWDLAGGETPVNLSICYSIIRHHSGTLRLDIREQEEPSLVVRFPSFVP
ncbi:MAG: histidine kinase dimerization/phospho-acceptor domain-containing protein [Desulfobaccales bacterium]|jgi:signal transduction histidine kinase